MIHRQNRLLPLLAGAMVALVAVVSTQATELRFRNSMKELKGPMKNLADKLHQPLAIRPYGCSYFEGYNGVGQSWRVVVTGRTGPHTQYGFKNLPASAVNRIASVKCDRVIDEVNCHTNFYNYYDKRDYLWMADGSAGLVTLDSRAINRADSVEIYCGTR